MEGWGDGWGDSILPAGQMRQTILDGVPYCVVRKLNIGTDKGTTHTAKIQQARMG